MVSNKKILFLTNLLIPWAWLWGLYHCQAGNKMGWVFPNDAFPGPDVFGMVLWDWLFYIVTINFFTTIILFDPLKRYVKLEIPKRVEQLLKKLWYLFMVWCFVMPFCMFGSSGKATAIFFVLPSLFLYLYIWKYWDMSRFVRTGILTVPIEFIWDHWAVGRHQQWIYVKSSNMWGELWFNGIPIEMTPYLGFAAWFFTYGVVFMFYKILADK